MKGVSSANGIGRTEQQRRAGNWTDSRNREVLQDILTAESPPAFLLAALRNTAFGGGFFVSKETPVSEKCNRRSGLLQKKEVEAGLFEKQKLIFGTHLVK